MFVKIPKRRTVAILLINIVIIVVALVVFGMYRVLAPKNIAQHLREAGMVNPLLNEFVITEVRTHKLSDFLVTNISAQKDEIIVHLVLTQRMGPELARLYEEEKKVGIDSLFLTQPAHYPGAITREVECPVEFQPKIGTAGNMDYYIMFANERFSLGVCSSDAVKYTSVLGFGYCEENDTFVEIKLFYLPEVFERENALGFLSSFRCGTIY